MNELKWKLHWHKRATGEHGTSIREAGGREAMQEAVDEWTKLHPNCDYWVQPEAVPEVKPADQQWRLHWRYPNGITNKAYHPNTLAQVKKVRDDVNGISNAEHWIQPAESLPALNGDPTSVRWRVHYRNQENFVGGKQLNSFATLKEAEKHLNDYPCGSGLDYWIQPEAAAEMRWCGQTFTMTLPLITIPPIKPKQSVRIRGILKGTPPATQQAFGLPGTFDAEGIADEIDRLNRQSSLYHFWPEKA